MKELKSIKNEADDYVQLLADIGGGDVELIDLEGVRISGAGPDFGTEIGKVFPRVPLAYKKAFKTKKQVVIDDPKNDPLVLECDVFKDFDIQALIASPIVVEGQVIGTLGTTMERDPSKVLIESFELYTGIVKQTADFISIQYKNMKDSEEKISTLDVFETLVRNIEEGAVVVNELDEVLIINTSAKAQLGIEKIINNDKIEITKTGDRISDSEEFIIKLDNKETTVLGEIIELNENLKYKYILLFKDMQQLKSNIYDLTSTVNIAHPDSIIGTSARTKSLKEDIVKVANSISTVLITGESGTGKEMVATAIWKSSDRKDERFVAINCAAIPEALLESELFGYVKGAFTSADPKGRMGKFELANKGVIFLDEIGDMPLYLQSKLLRVIQERKISRIGSNQVIPLDVRIIAATNQDLKEMIRQNRFREDLFYRLNVIPIDIPPLRERQKDIKDLFYYYIEYYRKLFGKRFERVEDDVLKILYEYPWPGNVRELENAVEYMVNMMEYGVINKNTLPKSIFNPYVITPPTSDIIPLNKLEEQEILKALNIYGDDTKGKEMAARALGIGIATLYRKIQNINIEDVKPINQ